LQTSLEFLVYRLVRTYAVNGIILWNTVDCNNEPDLLVVYDSIITVERRQSTWTSLTYGQTHDNHFSSKLVMKSNRYEFPTSSLAEVLRFDDSLLIYKGKIRLARALPIRYLSVQVRSSIIYNNRFEEKKAREMTKQELRETNHATHLILHISPSQEQNLFSLNSCSVLPSIIITIESKVLELLLTENGRLEEAIQNCEGQQKLWKNYIDRILSLMRLDYTTENGIAYNMVGSFSDPVCTSQPWPDGMLKEYEGENDELEDELDD
jgi:hypothetical protein